MAQGRFGRSLLDSCGRCAAPGCRRKHSESDFVYFRYQQEGARGRGFASQRRALSQPRARDGCGSCSARARRRNPFRKRGAQEMFGVSLDDAKGKTSAELKLNVFREDGTDVPFAMRPSSVAIRTGKAIRDDV